MAQKNIQQLLAVPAKDIMTETVLAITPDDSLAFALKALVEKKVHTLMVVTRNKLMGTISEEDFLFRIEAKDLENKTVELSRRELLNEEKKHPVADRIEASGPLRWWWLTMLAGRIVH